MKQKTMKTGTLVLIIIFLIGCMGSPEGKADKAKSRSVKKALTLDQKAQNTFKNTTIVFTGSMVLAFSDAFKGQAQAFADAFVTEMDEESIKTLDEQIAGLGEQTLKPLEEMITHMDDAFDNMAKENLTVYEKMFLHDVVKEGVAITEKYDLPTGFRPLSQNLNRNELKRYILKVSADGQNTEDPIIKTYIELFEWFQKVSEEFNADPEIQSFMESFKK